MELIEEDEERMDAEAHDDTAMATKVRCIESQQSHQSNKDPCFFGGSHANAPYGVHDVRKFLRGGKVCRTKSCGAFRQIVNFHAPSTTA